MIMNKTNVRRMVVPGVLCVVFTVISAWHSVKYNNARIIKPMDYSEYTFRIQDLPMILSIGFIILYVLYLFFLMVKEIRVRNSIEANTQTVRNISPGYGLFGFFGLFGFLGFWTYSVDKTIFPFVFFVFFGFFGYFYTAKLSGTLMDERFRENQVKAGATANKTALTIIFAAVLVLGQGRLMGSLEFTLIAFVIVVSLALALEKFLSQYLLYRYDQEDGFEESGE